MLKLIISFLLSSNASIVSIRICFRVLTILLSPITSSLYLLYVCTLKTFRTDGHEKEENIHDHISHLYRYLELEKICYRWIQVPRKRIMELIEVETLPKGFDWLGREVKASKPVFLTRG
jgi:hypothetical protein